jgi:gamma-glutamyl AIG2-like cyclotransferase
VRFNGRDDCRVPGIVFEISDSELSRSDAYEPAGYRRIAVVLASGRQAFVYAA